MFNVLSFVIGILVGLAAINVPELHFKFNSEVKLFEVLNFILTLSLGLVIPFLVKKWIEDNRNVKSFLADEVKNLITSVENIKEMISSYYSAGKIEPAEKDKINYAFHEIELKLQSISTQFSVSFNAKSKFLMDDLKESYFVYKDYLTGGELMVSSFTRIDDKFYREHNQEHEKFCTKVRVLIHKIHKL